MRNNKGFSLVELIVVIAIMAILAAVAVVGFSFYIPKAQQAADKQLVSDIESALNLYMYSDPITDHPIGKLVISQDGVKFYGMDGNETPLAGTDVEKALIASFGTNYQNELKLKYDSWTASSSLISGMVAGEAGVVKDSSFLSGDRADQLLQDVEKFTGMAANLAGAMGSALDGTSLANLYGQDLLDETAEKYNIKVTDDQYKKPDGKVDWDKWGTDHPQEFSNMLVLAASVDNQNKKMDGENTYELSGATNLIYSFSSYYAFAAACPEFSPVLDKYMDAMNASTPTEITTPYRIVTVNPVTDATTGKAWYDALNAELNFGYKNKDGMTYAQYTTANESGYSNSDRDKAAFGSMLSSLGNVTADDLAGDLGNANLFTQGAVKDKYDQYLDAVDMMYGYSGDFQVNPGEIAIIYNQNTYSTASSID